MARDSEAHLAAATSTGGTRGKRPGRVGDSPLIGSGTWADDRTCAVSGTGDGEIFIRTAFAHEIDARLRLGGESLECACRLALERVAQLEGAGGCVAVAVAGDAVLAHNTRYMARGEIGPEGPPRVALYADEPI